MSRPGPLTIALLFPAAIVLVPVAVVFWFGG